MLELSFDWSTFIKAFLAIFVIMDTLGNVPIFMVFTEKYTKKHRVKSANEAFYVATLILLLFL